MNNFGMFITMNSNLFGGVVHCHNVTRFYYYTNSIGVNMIAIESDIHSTGVNYEVENVKDLTIVIENSLAEDF